jgi:hypothetical protein
MAVIYTDTTTVCTVKVFLLCVWVRGVGDGQSVSQAITTVALTTSPSHDSDSGD